MSTLKLTTNKALQSARSAQLAIESLQQIARAERIAPVNVHSHGQAIANSIAWLESALELAKTFQLDVQGR